jgi:N-acyl-D-aspartate/D-glutamate deacylase
MADLIIRCGTMIDGASGEPSRAADVVWRYVATIVSGVPVHRDGEPTGALPGRVACGAHAAPA